MPCRINKRRIWSHRIVLEAAKHHGSCFVTLTYSDEFVPADGSLKPEHTTLWLKRLREAVKPVKLRFFLVGEYGEQTCRPHYHVALFGLNPFEAEEVVHKCWGMGHTMCGTLEWNSAQYVAGYVTKKMTSWDDVRLKGRHPEFSRMSLKPGIGADAMVDVAKALTDSRYGAAAIADKGDVPETLHSHGKNLPLGRYLRRKLREEVGFDEVGFPEKPKEALLAEMSALREEVGEGIFKVGRPFVDWDAVNVKELRAKIWKKRGSV